MDGIDGVIGYPADYILRIHFCCYQQIFPVSIYDGALLITFAVLYSYGLHNQCNIQVAFLAYVLVLELKVDHFSLISVGSEVSICDGFLL